jgi:D-aspartate ligase
LIRPRVWSDESKDFISARILGTGCFYPPSHRIHNAYWRWGDPGPGLVESAKYALRRVIGYVSKIQTISELDMICRVKADYPGIVH